MSGGSGPEYTNRVHGKQLYNEVDKTDSFTLAIKLSVSGNSLDYDTEFTSVNILHEEPGMPPHGTIQKGAKHRGSLRRE